VTIVWAYGHARPRTSRLVHARAVRGRRALALPRGGRRPGRTSCLHDADRGGEHRKRPERLDSEPGGPLDRGRAPAAREGGAHGSAVVGDRAARARPDRPARAGIHRSPGRGCRRRWDATDHAGAELALLGLLRTRRRAASVCGRQGQQGQLVGPGRPGGVRGLRGVSRPALRPTAGRNRNLERARPVKRSVLRGPQQGRSLRGDAACGIPGDQASQPERDGPRRLARGLQRRVPARAIRGGHQGLLRRAGSTTSRSPRCARSTKHSWPTATPPRCGWTSSAGPAAGHGARSSRNRAA